MEIINQYHFSATALIARLFFGCLFFYQGYDAVFKIKIKNVFGAFENDFIRKGVPRFFTVAASWFTSYTELICGVLLIVGLFEYAALYLLGINLIIAAIGFGISTPMWDTKYVCPRLALILLLLIIPQSWNTFSLHHLFFKI